MLSLLFTICMIWFVGKFFIFGLRVSWGIMKLLCTVIFFPVILIGMVVGGLMYIAYVKKKAVNQKWFIAARGLWIILTFLFRHLEVQD